MRCEVSREVVLSSILTLSTPPASFLRSADQQDENGSNLLIESGLEVFSQGRIPTNASAFNPLIAGCVDHLLSGDPQGSDLRLFYAQEESKGLSIDPLRALLEEQASESSGDESAFDEVASPSESQESNNQVVADHSPVQERSFKISSNPAIAALQQLACSAFDAQHSRDN